MEVYWPSPLSAPDIDSRIELAEDKTNDQAVIHELFKNSTYAKLKVVLPGVTDTELANQLLQTVLDTLSGDFSRKREAIEITFSLHKREVVCPEGLVPSAYNKRCGK